jgi:hypothetical protein
MDSKEKTGMTVAFLIFMAIGAWAILDPTAMEGYVAMGKRASMKQLMADFWGAKLGFGMIVMGALALVGLHMKTD